MPKTILPYAIMVVTGALALWRGAPYAALPFLLFLASWITVRAILTRGEDNPVTEERGRSPERSLTTGVFFGMIFLPCVTLATPLVDFAAYAALRGLVAAGLLTFLLLYIVRIRLEEQMMRDRFGAEWDAYAARTPRLLPKLRA